MRRSKQNKPKIKQRDAYGKQRYITKKIYQKVFNLSLCEASNPFLNREKDFHYRMKISEFSTLP